MPKFKTKYVCSSCGFESIRWIGKCPQCNEWNTFSEEIIESAKNKPSKNSASVNVFPINQIEHQEEDRIKTGISEFDRVLGGGLVLGSVVLIGGDPGIGKSTLVLQAASKIKSKVLYATGEESIQQIKARASRLKIKSESLFIAAETDLHRIMNTISIEKPEVVIIDSIQTIYNNDFDNSPGTVTQIRECTAQLMEDAKKNNYSVIIIGHVTKEGVIAGPKILEHIVDTVIQFEGEFNSSYRIIRAQKNRFGSTNEIGIFEMLEYGLEEVKNPSSIFINEHENDTPGSTISAIIEGTRPLLVEVQALVTHSNFGYPQRVSNGFDQRRLSILLAVIEKRGGYKVSANNVFLNMTGGVRVDEPSVDLAVCCSVISSLLDRHIDKHTVVIGEIGLSGEIRIVNNIEKRIQEAEKLNFKRIVIPSIKNKKIKSSNIQIIQADTLIEAISVLLK